MDAPADDDRIRRYLLADLTEAEQEQLEEQFFEDDDLLDRVRAGEADLIDDYVRGALSDEAHREFESQYQRSPDRRRRIEFARALQASVVQAARGARPERTGWRERMRARLGFSGPRLRLGISLAALVVVAGGASLLWIGLRTEPGSEPRGPSQPPPSASPAAAAPEAGRTSPALLSLALSPGLVRDAAAGNIANIAAGVRMLRLLLQIDPSLHHSRYRVRIQNVDSQAVWIADNVLPSVAAESSGRSVIVEVPSRVLPSADYVLFLQVNEAGRYADVAEYVFSVRR